MDGIQSKLARAVESPTLWYAGHLSEMDRSQWPIFAVKALDKELDEVTEAGA